MQNEPQVARQAIVEVALQLAERSSWDQVHLYDVAQEMGIPLADIHRHFGDKDAVAEAWFDRADAALLRVAQTPGWRQLALQQRLHYALCAWFDALAPHRTLTREMLGYKLQPEHIHLQVLGVMRISRTVQWIREAALLPAVGWRRELTESVLTTTYLVAFAHWLFDESPGARRTQSLLNALLPASAFTGSGMTLPWPWQAFQRTNARVQVA